MKTAVLLIVFNRLNYTKETLKAVSKAKPPRLYISCDGPRIGREDDQKKCEKVRQYVLSHINWPCQVFTRFLKENSGGCKFGVSGAINWFFQHEKEGIILEDDCVADISFFTYCETLLDKYRTNKKIWHIAGDAPIDVNNIKDSYYFAKIQHCWGWATWADRWKHFTLDVSHYTNTDLEKFSHNKNVIFYWKNILNRLAKNEIDTWDYQWTFVIVSHNGFCINPTHNLISNIGVDGVHYSNASSDHALNKKNYSMTSIHHPQFIHFNQKLIDRIYREKFRISYQNKKEIKIYLFGFIPLFKIEGN